MPHDIPRARRAFLVLAVAAAGGTVRAQGEPFPSRPVRLVVPTGPGSGADTVARLLGHEMARHLGQPVVVEDIAGAGGLIGAGRALTSPPDGHTVLFAISNLVTTSQHLFAKLPYDVERARPVGLVAKGSYLLLAARGLPASTLPELVALARLRPGRIAYASAGTGGTQHLGMELLKQATGIDLLHVPYKVSSGAHTDLMAGDQVQLMLDPVSSALPLVRAGKLKALAATGVQRVPGLPDVPTVGETVKDFDLRGWNSLWVPPDTPDGAVEVLNRALRAAVADPDLARRLRELGMEPQSSTPGELAVLRAKEAAAWGRLIAARGIRVE